MSSSAPAVDLPSALKPGVEAGPPPPRRGVRGRWMGLETADLLIFFAHRSMSRRFGGRLPALIPPGIAPRRGNFAPPRPSDVRPRSRCPKHDQPQRLFSDNALFLLDNYRLQPSRRHRGAQLSRRAPALTFSIIVPIQVHTLLSHRGFEALFK